MQVVYPVDRTYHVQVPMDYNDEDMKVLSLPEAHSPLGRWQWDHRGDDKVLPPLIELCAHFSVCPTGYQCLELPSGHPFLFSPTGVSDIKSAG